MIQISKKGYKPLHCFICSMYVLHSLSYSLMVMEIWVSPTFKMMSFLVYLGLQDILRDFSPLVSPRLKAGTNLNLFAPVLKYWCTILIPLWVLNGPLDPLRVDPSKIYVRLMTRISWWHHCIAYCPIKSAYFC